MCNRYGNHIFYRQYVEGLKKAQINLASPSHDRAPNLEPRDNIFPTDAAPILRLWGDGVELTWLRWGLIPSYHKGNLKEWKMLTTNARSDNLKISQIYKNSFEQRRCLVPVDQFYEWTGEKNKKTKWSFSRTDIDWFCFAGIWNRAECADGIIESFAFITIDAGPDMRPYHHRQPVILGPNEYREWLSGTSYEKLLVASPKRLLKVEEAPPEKRALAQ